MGPVFMAVMAVMSVVSSFAAAANQASAAKAQARNAADMARMQIDEIQRTQKEVNEAAQSDKGQRARQADKEFASLVVSFAERGGLGTINAVRGGQEVGYNAGMDLAKIEANRRNVVASLQSKKQVAHQQALNIAEEAKYTAKGAFINALGSSFQIGANYAAGTAKIDAAKGKTG